MEFKNTIQALQKLGNNVVKAEADEYLNNYYIEKDEELREAYA